MPVNPEDYNSDAISGEKLRALMQDEVYDRLKGDVPESIAVFLCSLKAQVDSIQKAVSEKNLGECVADSIDAQSLKVGGTDVKTKQTSKSNPSASSGSANTFVDAITQNENGELTATRRVMKMYSGTGSNTDAPMTQKAVKDALDTKAPIASPTFTGTPAAPTASGSTYTTQIATTEFVHDAIENDLKKAADVSGMGNDDTHAYSGEAVSMAISSAVSGNVGGFLGNMTVAQMNAYTNPKMGDNAIVTDTGTITVGSEQCVILTAPSEVRWTTSGSWKISSAGYVRDTQVATTSVPGLVKLNTSNGGVELNSSNQMVVHGWSTKQDSLPYANGKYGIDISGSSSSASVAGELEKVSLGQVDELPVSLIVNSNFKAGTFLLKGNDYGGQPFVLGDVTIPNNQWYRFTVSGQTSTDCVITLEPCTGGSLSPFNIFKILVDNGSSRTDKVMKVVRVPYESTTSAVGDSSKPVYVDESGEIKECNPSSMSVGYASAAESGSALAQAIAPDADVALIVYGDATYSSVKALYNAGKKLYLVTGGNIQPSGKFEYRIPLTLITYDANNEVNAFYFEYAQDDRNGASEVSSIAVYRLDSTGWTSTAKAVGYATNAGHSSTSDTATNATNDNGGAKIRDAYIHSVTRTTSTTGYVDSFYSFEGASTAADANGFLNVTLNATQVQVATTRYKVAQGMQAMQKNGTDQMPNNVCKICLRADAYVAYGYNGFTCLGHEAPLASGQKYYGWFANLAQYGAVIEIDFDYIAYGETAVAGAGDPPSHMKVSFAACTDNNAFIYGFAIDKSSIFASAQETIWFVGAGGQVQGHVHMVGRGANATIQRGTRVFVGAVQTTSNGHYLVMQVSNISIKVTGGRIYDMPNLP